jgi:hypothetical protein
VFLPPPLFQVVPYILIKPPPRQIVGGSEYLDAANKTFETKVVFYFYAQAASTAPSGGRPEASAAFHTGQLIEGFLGHGYIT